MNKKMSKRQRDIKSKLMAAICMLLVSSIMMVSSTYAWFTLSTAPEVTGIQTAVGANGNLEMALLPVSGDVADIKSEVGDSMDATNDATVSNITWGNLVDLGSTDPVKTFYGLDKITLLPSQLNVAASDVDGKLQEGNPQTLGEILLSTPVYGADGRVNKLDANTVTSTAVDGAFPTNDEFGVRAVGVASGMTDRQLAYRNARSTASTAMAQAKNAAATSLTNNGNALANIAITHGTNSEATHTQEDVAALLAIVNDLLGTTTSTGVLEYIEEAYLQYILAYGASQEAVAYIDDTDFIVFKGAIEGAESLDAAIDKLEEYGATLPTEASDPIEKLATTKANVESAKSTLDTLAATNADVTWNDLYPALNLLANPDTMTVNGITVDEIKTDEGVNHLINTIGGGLTVSMATGGGVYADVADHCGDYNASITIKEINYGGLSVKDLNARMATESTQIPPYLSAMGTKVADAGSPSSATDTAMPITDMYGYIIDLAFRTNAAESSLLLQRTPADRIYDENGNEETLGHGSTMTFKATTTDFDDDSLKDLMSAIRIVFFQKDSRDVIATGKLDVASASSGADGITAEIYLYKVTPGGEAVYTKVDEYVAGDGKEYFTMTEKNVTTYPEATGITADNFATSVANGLYIRTGEEGSYTYNQLTADSIYDPDATYYASNTTTVPEYTQITAAPTDGSQVYVKSLSTAGENRIADDKIMALTQNTATQLSVLVYLDGNHVTNADVAATAATSATGTMNLQFSSSATLVPMEYADLHLPATATEATTEATTESQAADPTT